MKEKKFEDESRAVYVWEEGTITIFNKKTYDEISFAITELPTLRRALAYIDKQKVKK